MGGLQSLGLSCVVLLLSCGSVSVTKGSLDQPVALRVDQSAEYAGENLRVGFNEVRNDSRCPTHAVCVWEGFATVVLWLEKGSEPRQELSLSSSNQAGHSTRGECLGYEIEVLGLAPPNSGHLRQSDYRVTLAVRAK